jgi:hypothetical protein
MFHERLDQNRHSLGLINSVNFSKPPLLRPFVNGMTLMKPVIPQAQRREHSESAPLRIASAKELKPAFPMPTEFKPSSLSLVREDACRPCARYIIPSAALLFHKAPVLVKGMDRNMIGDGV